MVESGVRRGRPRSHSAHQAVLGAAYDLLVEGGLPALTIEAVAARSGITKPTIYRRWPNRTAVATAAFVDRMLHEVPLVDTGDPRVDLIEQVRRVAEFYTTAAGGVLAQLIAAGVTDDQAADDLWSCYFSVRREELHVLWQRAIDARVVRADIVADDAMDLLFGPILYRLLIGPRRLDGPAAAAMAGLTVDGLAPR
ncbi:MAG TPA: TetR-like C-terminal domain-containing protein [Acidimicrobiales bacterium]|jgi:AcrR family transcriptional regulator|nr:TetR-like C-terminal domain-containing protein [Acidimicrobiales bacterium]